ncbi:hypothetical protein TNCT_294311 [Trichonephila clavata]|uniref:Uncharacterized protein n=1 Tax=Trichonephila clavata TaxID=2740835 RepID=A0A8X6G5N4_TRICU|nr:hypothetical protein TNCT_294311 [Trichonephila clavata]
MRLVTVLVDKGTCAIFSTAASPRSSRQTSLVADKINSSPIVNGFLALAIWLATKYDALSAFSFIHVVAFINFFCSSCSCFFFQNTSRTCLLIQGAWHSSGKAVLKVSLCH